MKIRKIAVVTGARSEYGILKPLVSKIESDSELSLSLLVTGMHLCEEFGNTKDEIEASGYDNIYFCPMYDTTLSKNKEYYAEALSKSIYEISSVLLKNKPDIVIVLGDRLEALGASLAAACLKIPIAHIHGGDKTDDGHIDESIRHSISRFSHLHFTASESHSQRLLKMGESSFRIFNVGALGIDSIISGEIKPKEKLLLDLNFKVSPKEDLITCIFHSSDDLMGEIEYHINCLIDSILEIKKPTVWIYPNNDPGNKVIIKNLKKIEDCTFIKTYKNINHEDYVSLLYNSSVMVGNSSSGIIEAATFNIPVVNVGSRNKDRESSSNVMFVDSNKNQIVNSIKKALTDKNFIEKIKKEKNVYGEGIASNKILEILKYTVIDDKFMKKMIEY